jgi:hypothetical protein
MGRHSPNVSTILLRLFLLQFFPKPIRAHQILPNEETLWKNCRKILRTLDRQRSREELWKNRPGAKSFYNSATILPQFFPAALPVEGPQNHSTILPSWLFTLVRKQRFYCDFVEELGACQIRGRIFLAAAD